MSEQVNTSSRWYFLDPEPEPYNDLALGLKSVFLFHSATLTKLVTPTSSPFVLIGGCMCDVRNELGAVLSCDILCRIVVLCVSRAV